MPVTLLYGLQNRIIMLMCKNIVCDAKSPFTFRRCALSANFVSVGGKHFRGEAVSPATPRTEAGLYWGYSVRFADSFSSVFTGAPFEVRSHSHTPTHPYIHSPIHPRSGIYIKSCMFLYREAMTSLWAPQTKEITWTLWKLFPSFGKCHSLA